MKTKLKPFGVRDPGNSVFTSERDRRDAQKRARKRVERQMVTRERLRQDLRGREYIRICHQGIETLMRGQETVTDAGTGAKLTVPLDRARVQAIKAAVDSALRLLDRLLPPLKAIEVSDLNQPNGADVARLSTAELTALVRKMHQAPAVIEDAEIVAVPATQSAPIKAPWK